MELQRMKTLFRFDLFQFSLSYQVEQSNFSFSKVVCVSSPPDQKCHFLIVKNILFERIGGSDYWILLNQEVIIGRKLSYVRRRKPLLDNR